MHLIPLASEIKPSNLWLPFAVAAKADRMRSILAPEGVGDRLRAVAFAEIQARDGFQWGLDTFPNAKPELRRVWAELRDMEAEHAQILLNRAQELGISLSARKVAPTLYRMFQTAASVETFLYLISTAEARGREVGLTMVEPMRSIDAESAAIFEKIAADEADHVAIADSFLAGLDLEVLRTQALASRTAAL